MTKPKHTTVRLKPEDTAVKVTSDGSVFIYLPSEETPLPIPAVLLVAATRRILQAANAASKERKGEALTVEEVEIKAWAMALSLTMDFEMVDDDETH